MRSLIALIASAGISLAQGVWERKADYPLRATEVSVAVIDGKVYVVCGLTDQGSTKRMFVYDPRVDTWSEAASAPLAGGGDHCNVAAAGGKLYLLGAIRIGSSFVDGNTYEYDPAMNRWSTVATMPVPRAASGVAAIGSKIYVAGGLTNAGSVDNLDVFDTVTRQWTSLRSMPTRRDHLTAQAVNGKLYAIAGRAGNVFTVNEEYDPATNIWTTRAPIPTARGGLASGVLNNRIIVFGGEGQSGTPEGTFRQNEEYDPATNTWRSLAAMPVPRHGLYGASLEGRILVPSGGPVAGANFSNVTDAFYLPPASAPSIQAIRDAASDGVGLSPGTLASLYGERLSFGEQVGLQFPLRTQMNATAVKVNGASVPLLYVGSTQVNFLLPYELPAGPITVTVSNAGSDSAPTMLTLLDSSPAIFMTRLAGRRGAVIEIYATGLGRVTNPPPAGEAAPSGSLVRTVETPVVMIGGQRAEVVFSGLAPGFAGLYQVNARIAANANTGPAIPVRIEVSGRMSNTVNIAIE